MVSSSRLSSLLISMLSVILITALFLAHNSPATGYEYSIYSGTPSLVWLFLSSAMIGGISICLYSLYDRGERKIIYSSLLVSILSFFSIIGLLIIRGYFMWTMSGDPASHIGTIRALIESGHLVGMQHYPVLHILSSQIIQTTNLNIHNLHLILPFIICIFSPVFYYILAKNIFKGQKPAIIVTILSLLLTQGWFFNFTPNYLANWLFPFYLFVSLAFLKNPRSSYAIILPLSLLSLFLSHVVVFVALGIFIISFFSIDQLQKKMSTGHSFPVVPIFILMLSAIVALWSLGILEKIFGILRSAKVIGMNFITGDFFDNFIVAQEYGINIVEYGLLKYGILALQFFIVLYCYIKIDKNSRREIKSLGVTSLLILFMLGLSSAIDFGFNSERFLYYIRIILLLVLGFYLYKFLRLDEKWSRDSCKRYIGAVSFFAVVFLIGLVNVYPSNLLYEYNNQSTAQEISGFHWTINEGDANFVVSTITVSPFRLSSFLDFEQQEVNWDFPFNNKETPPYHFGYDSHASLSEYYANNTYLLLTERDYLQYIKVFPELASVRFIESDFERLSTDGGVNRIYSNAEFGVWKI